MQTLWNDNDRALLLARFERLAPSAPPRWGTFDAPRMVTHVTDALRAGLGELEVSPVKGPLGVWPVNVLVMFYMPWPKGAPTAPELLARSPSEWSAELNTLRAALDRFATRDRRGAWARHAAFGDIGGDGWGRLMHRHMDHHLRQFGG